LRIILLIITVALVALVCRGTGSTAQRLRHPQDVAEPSRGEGIPAHFSTYSLFLVCNPQWLEPERNEDVRKLYSQFQNFGRVIGGENLAVWFWNLKREVTKNSSDGVEVTQGLDVERSVRFCKAWKLKPSAGPHLVVTSTYPNESDLSSGLPKDSAVYELGNMPAKNISELLAKLTDELVEKGHVDSPVAAPQAPPTLWVRLLEATQHTINSFGCAWSFKIDAGPVNASLQSCKAR
jgi:hypothetical protein